MSYIDDVVVAVLAGRATTARAIPLLWHLRVDGEGRLRFMPVAAPERDPLPRHVLPALGLSNGTCTHSAATNGTAS